MSTEQMWQTESTSLDDTLALAEQIGRRLRGGEVIELISDVGGGKTTFTKGLAKGLGSKETVHSPSFTLSNEYRAGNLTLYHFDFYRLREPGILRDELAEHLADDRAIVVVEWPEIVENVLPEQRVVVTIRATGETSRAFSFAYPEELHYIVDKS